jgi:hypothetical protein
MSLLVGAVLLLSGLNGVVMRGPTTPVCRVGTPCSAPAVGAILVFSRNGVVAARVRTGAGGRYAVRLTPGTYSVAQPVAPKIGEGLQPRQVVVRRGVFALVNFLIDTGIR